MGGLMGSGGSYEAPAVAPVPEKQATKSLTAGTAAAYQNQKDKQKKSRGLVSTIMAQKSPLAQSDQSGKTTLG